MKKIILVFLFIFITFNTICQTTYNQLFSLYGNNPYTSIGSSAIITKGSGYVIAACGFDTLYNNNLLSINDYKQTLYFCQLDSIGNVSKLHSFSHDSINYYFNVSSLIQTHDGGFCYASDMDDILSTDGNPLHFMIRFNANMDTLWTKIIPHDTIWEAIGQIRETSDNGFIFSGARGIGINRTDVLLFKTDSMGNQLWKKIIPMQNLSGAGQIIETPDKGFLIKGYSGSYIFKVGDPFLIKTDSAGNVNWIKVLGSNEYDGAAAIAVSNEGNYIVAYGYATYTYLYNEFWDARLNIIKYAPDGTVIWNRMYDTIRNGLAVCKIRVFPNNDFIVMGSHSLRDSADFTTSFLFKFNANGDSLWRKIYYMQDGYPDENYLADNVINADGGITACGWVNAWSQTPYQQIWLLKTDSMGNAPGPQNVSIIDLPYLYVGYGGLKVYPNPANDFIIAEYNIETTAKEVVLAIFDMQGRLQLNQQLKNTTNLALINVQKLINGTYQCKLLVNGHQKFVAKLIIQH